MDMHIKRAGHEHMTFARNSLGRNPHDQIGINSTITPNQPATLKQC